MLIYQNANNLLNASMDIYEIRLANLRLIIKETGKPARVADRLDMSGSQFSQIGGKNPTRNIGPEIARRIEEIFNKPRGWLDTPHDEEGSVASESKRNASQEEIEEALRIKEELVFVPRLDVRASMGPGAEVHSEQVVDYLTFKRAWIEKEKFKPENLALIDSKGDSMSPTINSGDLLLIDHSPIDRLSNGIYVINIEGDLLAKRVERQLDGSIRIISDNPKYPPQVITDEDAKKLTVVGKVVWAGGRM